MAYSSEGAIIDYGWQKRMDFFRVLIKQNPKRPIRKLQWEALKHYPLYHKEAIRAWMTSRIADIALGGK